MAIVTQCDARPISFEGIMHPERNKGNIAAYTNDKNLVVRTTSRRPGCWSSSVPLTATATEVFFTSFEFANLLSSLPDVCWPTVVVFFEKQQLDAFVSANGVGGESFCCPPPPPASFELVSAGTFANSGETPFCKLGYSNSRRLFRPPGPPAASPSWGGGRRGREGEEERGRPHIPHPELASIKHVLKIPK